MIEFKGRYYPHANAEAIVVLVQFDDVRLHVWRLSDPFFHLSANDDFHLVPAGANGLRTIRLTDGGYIATDDHAAVERLAQIDMGGADRHRLKAKHIWIVALLGFTGFFAAAWYLLKPGGAF